MAGRKSLASLRARSVAPRDKERQRVIGSYFRHSFLLPSCRGKRLCCRGDSFTHLLTPSKFLTVLGHFLGLTIRISRHDAASPISASTEAKMKQTWFVIVASPQQ